MVEQSASISHAAQQHVGVHQPEAAREKYTFVGHQAVGGFSRVVAHDQSGQEKFALDRLNRAPHSRIRRRQKSDRRQKQ